MQFLNVPWLRAGAGATPADGGCILQVIDWIDTGGWTDHPRCVHPYIREQAIEFNDEADNEDRQKLIGLIPRLMGTNEKLPNKNGALTIQKVPRGKLRTAVDKAEVDFYEKTRHYPGDYERLVLTLDVYDQMSGRRKPGWRKALRDKLTKAPKQTNQFIEV